jgi:pilus assembly protein CpaB
VLRIVTMASLGASAVLGVAALIVAKTSMPAMVASTPAAAALPGAPPASYRPVVVAAREIKFGDRLDAAHLTVVQLPPGAAPEGAFASIDAVLKQDGGAAPVALSPIAPREAVLPTKISGPGARASVAAEISEGMRAYTIKVNDVAGVGGHALPGDRVDVVLLRDLSAGVQGPPKNLVSQIVLQNVRVLGMDLNADPTANKPAVPATATLEVSMTDAQKLAVAADLGELSLALRRTGSIEAAPVANIRTRDFVGGLVSSAPAATAAAAPASPSAPAAPSVRRPAGPRLIEVVEGV